MIIQEKFNSTRIYYQVFVIELFRFILHLLRKVCYYHSLHCSSTNHPNTFIMDIHIQASLKNALTSGLELLVLTSLHNLQQVVRPSYGEAHAAYSSACSALCSYSALLTIHSTNNVSHLVLLNYNISNLSINYTCN